MSNSANYDIAIIGGGAAGLAAAVAAARAAGFGARGAKIAVLEKLDRVGKKILATGNGRCNLANTEVSPKRYSSEDGAALSAMLAPCERTLGFFDSLGLLCDVEESGRVYPYSRQASTVLDALRRACARLGVQELCSFDVSSIHKTKGGFTVSSASGGRVLAKTLVLAAGGCAAAQLGSNGDGFALAKSLGHSVTPLSPCLVPLKCEMYDKSLKGIRVLCGVKLLSGARELCAETGEVQFTEYGVSGIPAMQLSRFYSQKTTRDARVVIDFLPQLPEAEAALWLAQRARDEEGGAAENLLLGALNRRLAALILRRSGLEPSRAPATLTRGELAALLAQLKGLELKVTGALPWANAQVTRGGVPLGEIDPASCESRKCPSLFLAGELLDAAGECGGYNLHWAWTTGALAGESAARRAAAQGETQN